MNGFERNHTWKDTVANTAVLITIFLSTLSGVYAVVSDPAPVVTVVASTQG